jgi:glycosyltransferase involved in cell wall biosynthesis
MPLRVSIVLPAFNAAPTIARAVASLRTQTFTDWELIVIDDGSTDGTGEIVNGVARADDRVTLLARPHAGLVAALSAGLTAARGEFIARMDADDVAHPQRLAEQVASLTARGDIGVVGCLVEFGGDPVANEGYARHVEWVNSLVTPAEIALNRFIESPFAHPSVMFRRELVGRHGGYRSGEFPEDYELWLRWLDAGVRMTKVPRVLLTWHDTATRLSRTDPRYDPEAFFRMKAEWIVREVARIIHRPRVGDNAADRRNVFVWGAGRPTRKRAAHLESHGVRIAGYIDVDAKKTGRSVAGIPVITPDRLPPPTAAFVLGYVSVRGARELHRATLRARGYEEGRDFLMCA